MPCPATTKNPCSSHAVRTASTTACAPGPLSVKGEMSMTGMVITAQSQSEIPSKPAMLVGRSRTRHSPGTPLRAP